MNFVSAVILLGSMLSSSAYKPRNHSSSQPHAGQRASRFRPVALGFSPQTRQTGLVDVPRYAFSTYDSLLNGHHHLRLTRSNDSIDNSKGSISEWTRSVRHPKNMPI